MHHPSTAPRDPARADDACRLPSPTLSSPDRSPLPRGRHSSRRSHRRLLPAVAVIATVIALVLAVPVVQWGSTAPLALNSSSSTVTGSADGAAVTARRLPARESLRSRPPRKPHPSMRRAAKPTTTDAASPSAPVVPDGSSTPSGPSGPAPADGAVPDDYFGMHVLGPVENNLAGTGRSTLWPTSGPTTIRLLNTWGYSSTQGKYSGLWWSGLNPAPGVYDWSLFDKVWARLKAQGVTDVLYSFQSVPAWACKCPDGDRPPTDHRYLADFATAVAKRAEANGLPIRNWEAWNEPNSGKGYWLGTVPQMVTMAKTVHTALKAVDPTYNVLTPAPQGNLAAWMDGYLAAGGGAYADTLAFHGYTSSAPEAIIPLIDRYQALLVKHGLGDMPMWDTEAMGLQGMPNPVAHHANYLAVYYLVHYSEGVDRFYWYTWDDDHGRLWDPVNGVNAAGIAYEQVKKWMLGATPGPVKVNGSVYSVSLTRNGKSSLAVWDASGSSSFATNQAQVTDLAGRTRAITGGSVTIGKAPVLLSTP